MSENKFLAYVKMRFLRRNHTKATFKGAQSTLRRKLSALNIKIIKAPNLKERFEIKKISPFESSNQKITGKNVNSSKNRLPLLTIQV
jgi:hypothetical protein